jgi:hypothetical protein
MPALLLSMHSQLAGDVKGGHISNHPSHHKFQKYINVLKISVFSHPTPTTQPSMLSTSPQTSPFPLPSMSPLPHKKKFR